MPLNEITQKMETTALKDPSPSPSEPSQSTPPPPPPQTPIGPAAPSRQTIDELVADLQKTPLFMTELEENDDVAALQALAYEGTPLENASDFRDRGNECFKVRGYVDAREFYKKGIDILWLEERRRRLGGKVDWLDGEGEGKEEGGGEEDGKKQEEGEEEKEENLSPQEIITRQKSLLATLYLNRAACNLHLSNHRATWLDCISSLKLNPLSPKAYYRASKALLAVDRIREADDLCARGLALAPENKALQATAGEIIQRNDFLEGKKREAAEREARTRRREALRKAALGAREIRTRGSEKGPEMEDARIRLVPDEDDPRSGLVFPVVLLYPLDLQSDFIKAFKESDSLETHFEYIFPLPWDEGRRYTSAGVESYVETVTGGLLKMGKKVPLLKVLSGGKVEVVDEVVRIFVVPKEGAEGWVKEFKEAKAKQMGAKG